MAAWSVIVWAVVTPDLEDALQADLLEAAMALDQAPPECDLHVHVNIVRPADGTTEMWPPEPIPPQDASTHADLSDVLAGAACWNETVRNRFLVLWGHGERAFPSPGRDAGVPSAATVVAAFGDRLPDIIGYDACWMATAETVNTLAASLPKAVFVGSMVPEPISGWPYAELVRILCGPGSPKAVAAAVVQAYAASLSVRDWCMVALDLEEVGRSGSGLTDALSTLMTTTSAPAPVDFYRAAEGADILEDTDRVDLGALMRRLQLSGPHPEAAAVERALGVATVSKRRAGSLAGRDGLAVRVLVPPPGDPLPPAPAWSDYFPEV